MEEEVGKKVTRLRRRLSVEADEVKSPSTQSTPTKKRGGRLAAKPQLELIVENATETVPKRTRKSTARDIAEPVEEKTVTPSRRSVRIRSNSSLVSETPSLDVPEDKGTPSRRDTRIKSNTSIVAETTQTYDSPRAKRAARRLSQVGSDNETPITPARQTRRTRKVSTSSIDKVEANTSEIGSQIKEVIEEEVENNVKDTKQIETKNDPPLRKSPRLVEKTGNKSFSSDSENKENQPQSEKEKIISDPEKSQTPKHDKTTTQPLSHTPDKKDISLSSSDLIKQLGSESKKRSSVINKSASEIEQTLKTDKRHRTKSWTTLSTPPPMDTSFSSDSELSKKKNKKKNNSLNTSNISGSGDGLLNSSIQSNTDIREKKDISIVSSSKEHDKSLKQDSTVLNSSKNEVEDIEKYFEKAPTGVVQTLVFIEDSDSNSASVEKANIVKEFDGDQCVPVVNPHLEDTSKKQPDRSYEAMDIDESIPGNLTIVSPDKNSLVLKIENEYADTTLNKSANKSKRKSIPESDNDKSIDTVTDKSKRKSSITATNESNLNKSKRTSSISAVADNNNDALEKMNDKSLLNNSITSNNNTDNTISQDDIDGTINKSTRKSSVSDNFNIDKDKKSFNESKRKSAITNHVTDISVNKNSKRKSSISNNDNVCDTSQNKSTMMDMVAMSNNETNKSLKTSLVINIENQEIINETANLSNRKSLADDINQSLNKPKRKSSNSNLTKDDTINNKSLNKSKRKSSVSHDTESRNSTTVENKSTLVLSQIKDDSGNDVNMETSVPKDDESSVPKCINESNDQFSKSVNIPNDVKKTDSDKKNLSLTYSTSTPLQQKSLKKLGMINTSIIAPNSVGKVGKKESLSKSKKETSILSKESDDSDDEEENEDDGEEDEENSDESSKDESNMLDDEAEEGSDNYESGDSRDEDEKEYEEQNEIVEKGETLDSNEEEFSDDSDYEKDSFVVSSDQEDNDLLSGSGDDLSMSDNELSMSKESKIKYNERKKKEQKKASREMFEARHQLNNSDKRSSLDNPKVKKVNRQRLDSSDSDEEATVQPKKNRRQRIDSSQDISLAKSDADASISKKKKKSKRWSESLCESHIEKEIAADKTVNKIDPLDLKNVVKQEPKTPQKDLNISTVAITNTEEVEEVHVDENVSILKTNQTKDPLQATMLEDDDENDSISENEEITQNYESILKDLNTSKSKKIKSLDISLNLNKKTKEKSKEPIVDQLNLTQNKKSKKKRSESETAPLSEKLPSAQKVNKSIAIHDEGSSDSIDMKLLFPEDSNDSEPIKIPELPETDENGEEENENIIPLKMSEAKTNLLDNADATTAPSKDDSILNSGKKNKKRKSSIREETKAMEDQPSEQLSFFIDTTGTHAETSKTDFNTSIKSSAKKNKQKNNVSFANIEEAKGDDNSNESPLEVSYQSEKKNKKINETQELVTVQDNNAVTNTPGQSAKKKKKNKGLDVSHSKIETENAESADNVLENSMNLSVMSANGSSKKKNKKKLSESQIDTAENEQADEIANVSVVSVKEEKQKSVVEALKTIENNGEINHEKSKKRKRKSSANQTIEEISLKDDSHTNAVITLNESIKTANEKKKQKISHNDEDNTVEKPESINIQQQNPEGKKSKKKNKAAPQPQEVMDDITESGQKNKKRKQRDDDDSDNITKVSKQNSFDKIHVPRLPETVLNQLDKTQKDNLLQKKIKIVSTTSFVVEETRKRRNKPSNYLEESVYLNDSINDKQRKGNIKNPKVLPFLPTVSTSDQGFTTKFKVNVIPQPTQFVAQSTEVSNFKSDYLEKKRIKKMGTFEMYKRQRNIKISKF